MKAHRTARHSAMATKRTKTPWMKADAFGRSLAAGFGLALLVSDVAAMVEFLRQVIGARIIHDDEDFAVAEVAGTLLLLHADHAYDRHPLSGLVAGETVRGAGSEIRVYGADPDHAEQAARARGDHVLASTVDKPHGLRECFIVAPDGYVFVPSASIGGTETET